LKGGSGDSILPIFSYFVSRTCNRSSNTNPSRQNFRFGYSSRSLIFPCFPCILCFSQPGHVIDPKFISILKFCHKKSLFSKFLPVVSSPSNHYVTKKI